MSVTLVLCRITSRAMPSWIKRKWYFMLCFGERVEEEINLIKMVRITETTYHFTYTVVL
jgi:hypothetical protein